MDWGAVIGTTLTGMLTEVKDAIPTIAPFALGIMAITIGWKVIKKFIKSAG